MTEVTESDRAGQETDPAYLDVHAPMQVMRYDLDWRDAYAWENLTRKAGIWRLAIYVICMGLSGLILAILPEPLVGTAGTWQFFILLLTLAAFQYGLVALWARLRCRNRARRRYPKKVSVRLEIWGDHFVQHRSDLPPEAPQVLVPEFVRDFIPTSQHLFVPFLANGLLIIPVSAFKSADEMRAHAAAWEDLWGEIREELR